MYFHNIKIPIKPLKLEEVLPGLWVVAAGQEDCYTNGFFEETLLSKKRKKEDINEDYCI